jgi:hypothetical protein
VLHEIGRAVGASELRIMSIEFGLMAQANRLNLARLTRTGSTFIFNAYRDAITSASHLTPR